MSNKVMIKSFPNGIALHLDAEAPYEELISEIEDTFTDSEKFFRGNRLALSLEGRSLDEHQEKEIVRAITSKGGLNIVCLIGKDQERNDLYLRAIHQTAPIRQEECPVQFYRGTLTNAQILETKKSIIILGNVEAGCKVISDHDIIVIGALEGEAIAGSDGREDHFILALTMKPEKLRIADQKYKESAKGFLKKKPKQPQIALVKDSQIVVQEVTKELLNVLGNNSF